MHRKRFYTFVVAHDAGAHIRKFSVPYYAIYIALGFSIIGFFTTVYATYHYCWMSLQMTAFNKLKEESKEIKLANQKFQILSSRLEEKISALEVTSQRVSYLSGLDSKNANSGLGGQGGYSVSGVPAKSGTATDLTGLKNRQRDIQLLEKKFHDLQNHFSNLAIRGAHTPDTWPVNGYLTESFGYRSDPITGRREFHEGVDISAPHGKKVVAPADGVIVYAGPHLGYGNTVVIDHKFGYTTLYGHLSRVSVRIGEKVSRGANIGMVGSTGRSTGSHLHYEVRLYDRPMNPVKFLRSYARLRN